jgi:hypothetical protein
MGLFSSSNQSTSNADQKIAATENAAVARNNAVSATSGGIAAGKNAKVDVNIEDISNEVIETVIDSQSSLAKDLTNTATAAVTSVSTEAIEGFEGITNRSLQFADSAFTESIELVEEVNKVSDQNFDDTLKVLEASTEANREFATGLVNRFADETKSSDEKNSENIKQVTQWILLATAFLGALQTLPKFFSK